MVRIADNNNNNNSSTSSSSFLSWFGGGGGGSGCQEQQQQHGGCGTTTTTTTTGGVLYYITGYSNSNWNNNKHRSSSIKNPLLYSSSGRPNATIRLVNKNNKKLSSSSTTAAPVPRLRMCYATIFLLTTLYIVGLVFFYVQVDTQASSFLSSAIITTTTNNNNNKKSNTKKQHHTRRHLGGDNDGGSNSNSIHNRKTRIPIDTKRIRVDHETAKSIQILEQDLGLISCRRRTIRTAGTSSSSTNSNANHHHDPHVHHHHNHDGNDHYYSIDDTCPEHIKTVVLYNPIPRERYFCDGNHKIDARSSIDVQVEPTTGEYICESDGTERTSMSSLVTLFPVSPPINGVGMPPVVLRFGNSGSQPRPFNNNNGGECDIPCMESGRASNVCTRSVDPIIGVGDGISDTDTDADKLLFHPWTFRHSMEGPQYYPDLVINPTAYKNNQFYATTSYRSEIPLPYYSWAEYKIQQPAVQYSSSSNDNDHGDTTSTSTIIKGAVFLARNCHSRNGREDIVSKLIQHPLIRVDSLSQCLQNAKPPYGLSLNSNKKLIMSKYMFYLAFENQNEMDYITEKLWGPFEAGTIPIYYGAPNVQEHVPPHSIIHVNDFPTIDELAKYIYRVANNQTLYESYHEWRYKPLPPSFHLKYDFTNIHSTCRFCRWAYSRMYGFHWNPINQTISYQLNNGYIRGNNIGDGSSSRSSSSSNSNTNIKTLCVDRTNGLLNYPFYENYYSIIEEEEEEEEETKDNDNNDKVLHGGDLSSPTQLERKELKTKLEYWDAVVASSSTTTCNPQGPRHQVTTIDDGRYRRTVYSQDGVLDLYIQQLLADEPIHNDEEYDDDNDHHDEDPGYYLQLSMPFQKKKKKQRRGGGGGHNNQENDNNNDDDDIVQFIMVENGHVRIQNNSTRYTVITSPPLAKEMMYQTTTTNNNNNKIITTQKQQQQQQQQQDDDDDDDDEEILVGVVIRLSSDLVVAEEEEDDHENENNNHNNNNNKPSKSSSSTISANNGNNNGNGNAYSLLRVRIILEDIDTFHINGYENENFFGQLMIYDFQNPIEAFVPHIITKTKTKTKTIQ